jgi:bifunctional UDP-N-acetylglucosamine pyrophosphorylase/glucosamine-1-phosphate N-acetyltransferase
MAWNSDGRPPSTVWAIDPTNWKADPRTACSPMAKSVAVSSAKPKDRATLATPEAMDCVKLLISPLAKAETALYRRKAYELMRAGVTIIDPHSTYISDQVKVGTDTIIWPQTYLLGDTRIGSNCQVRPWAFVKNSVVENDVIFQASFAELAIVRRGARVGPYSRLRPKADVGPNAHVGNFTELKNTQLGAGSKANHLTYLGDAKIGKNVNIGAGSITCNYDGFKKFPTLIQDNAFIGSNVNLIAPVRVGAHSVVGAGSSINEDVPEWALVVERAPRVLKKGWVRQRLKKGKKR